MGEKAEGENEVKGAKEVNKAIATWHSIVVRRKEELATTRKEAKKGKEEEEKEGE